MIYGNHGISERDFCIGEVQPVGMAMRTAWAASRASPRKEGDRGVRGGEGLYSCPGAVVTGWHLLSGKE